MPLKPLIEDAANQLRPHLSPAIRRRFDDLLSELDTEGRAKLDAVLSRLYPGRSVAKSKDRKPVLTLFRKFRQTVKDSAIDAGIELTIESDDQNRTPPSRRSVWIELVGAASTQISRELARTVSADTAAGPGKEVPLMGVAYDDTRPIVRFFLVWSRKSVKLKEALLKRLKPVLDESPAARFVLTEEFEIDLEGKWRTGVQKELSNSDFALFLLSQALLNARFLQTEKIPANRIVPAALDRILPGVNLQGLDPSHIIRGEHDTAFAECSTDQKNAFALRLLTEMTRRIPDTTQAKTQQSIMEASREAAFEHSPAHFTRGLGITTTIADSPDGPSAAAARDTTDAARGEDALRFLMNWVKDPGAPPYSALLGEYGMGKTTLCKALTREIDARRAQGEKIPVPLYFDLRPIGPEARRGLTLDEILTIVLKQSWKSGPSRTTVTAQSIIDLVEREAAVVIWDGLDEVLVHLDTHAGQLFTRQLYRLIPPSGKGGSRLLISCRTHFFRTLPEQKAHFRAQDRDNVRAESYRAFLLLPFTEDQIRDYIAGTLPNETLDRVIETLNAVHNLRELAERPYTLSLIIAHFADIEKWKLEGRRVTGLALYRLMVRSWLLRDTGKHQLAPDHKQELMEEIAARLWRGSARLWSIGEIETWLDEYLAARPLVAKLYQQKDPALLREDLRTATFLVREGEDKFRFAHTSLQEFFLACYLRRALVERQPERWNLPRPSLETLDFLGQALFEGEPREAEAAVATLTVMRNAYRKGTSELAFDYALLASQRGYPSCSTAGFQLKTADLRDLEAKGAPGDLLPLMRANFRGARLDRAFFQHANLESAEFENAWADRAEFLDCRLNNSNWGNSSLEGAVFRNANLSSAAFREANCNRTRFINCRLAGTSGLPATLPYALYANGASPPLGAPISRSASGSPDNAPLIDPDPQPATHLPRLTTLAGHEIGVNGCAWSPDGGRVLSASDDNTLRIWDAATGEVLLCLAGHESLVLRCGWSPDGSRVLSASFDKTLRIWDAATGDVLLRLAGHEDWVFGCAWSPDGTRVLSASDDKTLKIWDAATGEVLLRLAGHENSVLGCAWSPDGTLVLSASEDKTLKIWDAATGDVLLRLAGHESVVNGCAWSPDGRRVLSASDDNTLRVWDTPTGDVLLCLAGHENSVLGCAWSPDGTRVLSASEDKTLRIWDAATSDVLLRLAGHENVVNGCAWSPDGRRVISASDDDTLRIWDATTGDVLLRLARHEGGVNGCAWSPDGRRVISASDDDTLRVWDATTGDVLLRLAGHEGVVNGCAWSADGRRILSTSDDNTLRIWDAATGHILLRLSGHANWVNGCAWSPDGSRVLSASDDNTLRIWDAATADVLLRLVGHANWVNGCAWSPDGNRVLSASDDATLRIWDAATGDALLRLDGHESVVNGCAWSPDGNRVLSASDDNTLRIWDATTGFVLLRLARHEDGVIGCAWSPDGSRVLSASDDATLRIWDAATGDALLRLAGHATWVNDCAWSPDGSRVLSASADRTLRIWDAFSGKELSPTMYHLKAPRGEATWATIDHPNNRIVACGPDAWRSLGWIVRDPADGMPIRLPAETYGPLPVKEK